MSANDGTLRVRSIRPQHRHSDSIPATALVLEQWSDEATFYIWHGATYTAKTGSQSFASRTSPPGGGEWSDPKSMVTSATIRESRSFSGRSPSSAGLRYQTPSHGAASTAQRYELCQTQAT